MKLVTNLFICFYIALAINVLSTNLAIAEGESNSGNEEIVAVEGLEPFAPDTEKN